MYDETMKKAMNAFLQQRINDCDMRENVALQEAYQQFEDAMQTLKSTLNTEQEKAFVQFENACSLVTGETTNCYYRAGFSDAVTFVLGWRDGT
ncbi:MAG: hypothetical protein RR415_14335, partial [Ruthenibacterium sp.]